ncbi:MAG: Branched-chain amino acid transporter, amino acid-binding protein [Polyangiaceae bacterium]|nr:Branched-chain amino acid transporter, amino acid-binding protein [Polyangiaceae bacterium]
MRTLTLNNGAVLAGLFTLTIAACNSLVGLDDLTVSEGGRGGTDTSGGGSTSGTASDGGNPDSGGTSSVAPGGAGGEGEEPYVGECMTNQECTDKAALDVEGAGGEASELAASVCIKPEGRCQKLLNEDCTTFTGDYLNDRAILLGSLFSIKGSTAATNLPRQQAAALAIEQINAVGGVPSSEDEPRPLVMVHCDESTNLVRAAEHLVKDLGVPAIVGPNTSQDTIDVTTKVTASAGTVVITPTAVASSIVSLNDKDLTWLMVPSDVQRAPLMMSQLGVLETQLKEERGVSAVKLGIVFRNDALGIGTRTSLNELILNEKGLTDPLNLGNNVEIDGYVGTATEQTSLVDKYVAFAPDIIVLAGTAEAVSKFMVPLEAAWTAPVRPHYVLIDSTKVPELIMAATNNDDLRGRVRGTGITTGPSGKDTPAEAYNGFKIDYDVRYPGGNATISGMGPAHDAAYAIGLALAATRDQPVSGKAIAAGLRKLASGPTKYTTLGPNLLPAFQKLAAGSGITAVGSFGVLDWDTDGAVKGGTLEMWCIGGTAAKPVYQSSGLIFDIMSQQQSGTYKSCTQ